MATSKDAILAELQAVETALNRVYAVGQSVTVPGTGIQATQASLAALLRRKRTLEGKLLALGGATASVQTKYGDANAVDWTDA